MNSNCAAFADVQEKACLLPSAGESAKTCEEGLHILCSVSSVLFFSSRIIISCRLFFLSLIQSLQDLQPFAKGDGNSSPAGMDSQEHLVTSGAETIQVSASASWRTDLFSFPCLAVLLFSLWLRGTSHSLPCIC